MQTFNKSNTGIVHNQNQRQGESEGAGAGAVTSQQQNTIKAK